MDNEPEKKKRRGRPIGQNFTRYSVMLSAEEAEWARDEPEGLSGLLRQCLKEIMANRIEHSEAPKKVWRLGPEPPANKD